MSMRTFPLADSAGTTGGTPRRERRSPLTIIVVGGALTMAGTSSAEPTRVWESPFVQRADVTASGSVSAFAPNPASHPEATRRAIAELRRISGLTWEQLGQLFEVSRRSVHFWASGKPLNAANEERLLRVLDVVRYARRGDSRRTRAALFDASQGTTPFDMLVSQRFEEAGALLGRGADVAPPRLPALSTEAQAARQPLPPDELHDAQHDRVHRGSGHGRAARSMRTKRGRS